MALDINNKDENLSPNANSLINNIRGSDEIPIDLKYFLKIFARRSRIFYFSTFIPFSIFLILAGLQRIINPTYRGYFKILISDPISKKDYVNDNLRTKPFAVFDYGARNNEILSNDIPTLIEYLKSESVLKSILNEYNINYDNFSRNLEVKIVDKSKNFDTDPQVLYIVYHHKNKKKGLKILNSVAETYLEASLKMKQKRLSEGLNFLDSQEPELKKNTKILRDNIAVFREKNNLLDPKEEALALKSRLNDLDDKILKLGSEKERLKIIKQEIIKGNLVSSGLEISENEGKLTGGLGLFVTDSIC